MKVLAYACLGICISVLALQFLVVTETLPRQTGSRHEIGIVFFGAIVAILSSLVLAFSVERGSPLRLFALIVFASELVFLVLG